MSFNPFLLAADNDARLLPLLRANPVLASQQDEHGYSLVHAAASYNHLDLLRALCSTYPETGREGLSVPVDLLDEDHETALFAVETLAAARVLVEELGLDTSIRNNDGLTACEKLEADGDYPQIIAFLKSRQGKDESGANGVGPHVNGAGSQTISSDTQLPPPPPGMSVNVAQVAEGEMPEEAVDPEFRRRIEALAARADFEGEAGQAELRQLVEDALHGEEIGDDREVRRARQG